jgi:hypothetical protein
MRRGALLLIALPVGWLSLSPAGTSARGPAATNPLPRLMLWAWERPTDLRDLDARVGVAFLAQTLIVRNGAVEARPRHNPLRVSPGTPLVAVTRIESGGSAATALSSEAVAGMAAAIAGTMTLPRVRGVQIDFDAVESERIFYRALVIAVRNALGPRVPLSVTALASWCAGDRWMHGLPIDEAVPMLFQMGREHTIYAGIAASPVAAAPECRTALGTSLDEPLRTRARARRVYVFNPAAWTAASIARAREVAE